MSNLLTYSQQIAIKKISSNNQSKFDELCREVENTDLKDLLGLALLQDLQTNPNTTANDNLLDGTSFTNKYSQDVTFKGIRYVLAYLIHSRYIGESMAADTFTGMVRKQHENADPLSEGAIKRLQATSKEIALSEFELIKEYLDLNYTTYPLWIKANSTKPFTPKFDSVSKTAYNSNEVKRCDVNNKRYI